MYYAFIQHLMLYLNNNEFISFMLTRQIHHRLASSVQENFVVAFVVEFC